MVQDVVNIGESLQGIDGGMVVEGSWMDDGCLLLDGLFPVFFFVVGFGGSEMLEIRFGVLEFIEHHLL